MKAPSDDWGGVALDDAAAPAQSTLAAPQKDDWGGIPVDHSTVAPVAKDDWGGVAQPASQQEVQHLTSDPHFDPAAYAAQTGDEETAFQARQALKHRTIGEKASAFGGALLDPSTYGNAIEGAGKFVAGLAVTPLHTLAQGAATIGAPIASALGNEDLANELQNEQQTQGAEATLGAQRIEQGLRASGRGLRNVAESVLPEDEATERQNFQDEIAAAKASQQLAQSRPLETGVVASAAKLATGNEKLSDVYSPEALAEQGARPVSPFLTESMAAAADPQNLLIPLAGEIPGVKNLAGGIVQGLGKTLQVPEDIMGAIPKIAKINKLADGSSSLAGAGAVAALAYHNPLALATAAGAAGLGKLLGWTGRALDEQGGALRSGIPSALDTAAQTALSAGDSAFGANTQRLLGNTANNVVATTLGFAPLNYALSGGDPRQFAESEVGAGTMGGIFGLAGDRQRMENTAAYRLAKYGSQQFTENPAYPAHQATMQTFSPQDQARINTLRGVLFGGTGTDVLVLDGPAFAKQVGAIGGDARGQFQPSPDGKTIYLNADAIGKTPAQKAEGVIGAAGHETGHAVVDFLKNAGREGDAQGLFGSISGAMTPEQIQALSSDYRSKLSASTPKGPNETPAQRAAIEAKIAQDNPTEKIVEENLAEITRRILAGRNIASFALPKPVLDRVMDGASRFMESRGWMPQIDPSASLSFKAQMVREAARRMTSILYETGKAASAQASEGPSVTQKLIEARSELAGLPTVTPDMPATKAAAITRQREAAQKAINDLQGMLKPATPFPAAGPKPVTPGTPITPPPPASDAARARISATSTLTAKNGMNLAEPDARELINQANIQHGSPISDPANLVKAALKIKGGGTVQPGEFAQPTSAISSSVGTGFNDHEGNRHTITGAATTPPKAGDFILNSDGNIRRVVKAWPDGKLDVVFAATNDTSSTQPVKPGTYTVLDTNVQPKTTTPGEPIPAGSGAGAQGSATTPETAPQAGQQVATANPLTAVNKGSHWVVQDAAGNPINSRTYKSEASANAAIRLQGRTIQLAPGPGGAPDILNHIAEMGGIAPKKATQEYDDMPALHKGYSAILGGTEAPEDLARDLHDNHNIGDGSVATMWQLVQEAMDTRRTTTTKAAPTDAADEAQQRQQAEKHVSDLVQTAEQQARQALQTAAIRPDGLKLTTKEGKAWKAQQGDKEILTAADAEDRVKRAKIDAILADIGDDQTGLHKETDAFGNEKIVGDFDPTDPRHKALADIGGLNKRNAEIIQKVQSGKGKVTYLRYRGALSGAENAPEPTRENIETGMENRKAEYDLSPAATRTDADATVHHKAVIPLDNTLSTPSGKITPRAIVLDNLLHNIASIFEGLPLVGKENPYGATKEQQAPLVTRDAQAYAQNHAHGYKGDGSGPMATFPDSGLPPADPNYTPETIPADRFAILNMAFGDERAGKFAEQTQKLAAAKAAVDAETNPTKKAAKQRTLNLLSATVSNANELYSLGAENNDWIDHNSGETNQLRAEMKAAGFDTADRLAPVVQNLSPQHILETSDKPLPVKEGDIPSVRPSGLPIDPAELAAKGLPQKKAIGAGFLPTENTPEGAPKEPGAADQQSAARPASPLSGATSKEDSGAPEDGQTPSERLTREAESAGVGMSIETMKGLLRGDKAIMDKVRARIQEKTGQPAKFLPATPYNPENDKTPVINEGDPSWVQRFEKLYQQDFRGVVLTPKEEDELDKLHQRVNAEYGSLNAFDKARKEQGTTDVHEPLRQGMRKTTQQSAKERLAARVK